MKTVKTIAQYAIKKWMEQEGFQMEWFDLSFDGNIATLVDRNGDEIKVRYDGRSHTVEMV